MIVFHDPKGGSIEFEEDALVRLCPSCSTPNPKDAVFCSYDAFDLQRAKAELKASEVIECSSCHRYNPPGAPTCRKCGEPLPTEGTVEETTDDEDAEPEYVKVCPKDDCRHVNPAAREKCERCYTDLAAVKVEVRKAGVDVKHIDNPQRVDGGKGILYNIAKDAVVELCHSERYTIGYAHLLGEQFEETDFVSDSHLDIFCREGQWFVRDHSSNGTYLNGIRIQPNIDTPLEPGVTISLGDPSASQPRAAHFRFSIHDN